MTELLGGLIAGAVHVWLGPDHLAAIAPLAVQRRHRFWSLGARWGIGHCVGVTIVALAALWIREIVSPDLLSTWGERIVGVLLFGIGAWGLHEVFTSGTQAHAHAHAHGGRLHVHDHEHAGIGRLLGGHGSHRHLHAALGFGVLHGVAGGSHFLGVLPALAFPTLAQALVYLGGFATGTVAAMVAFSGLADQMGRWSALKGPAVHRGLMGMASATAAGVGLFWIARV